MKDGEIALFELTLKDHEVRGAKERHYRLVLADMLDRQAILAYLCLVYLPIEQRQRLHGFVIYTLFQSDSRAHQILYQYSVIHNILLQETRSPQRFS